MLSGLVTICVDTNVTADSGSTDGNCLGSKDANIGVSLVFLSRFNICVCVEVCCWLNGCGASSSVMASNLSVCVCRKFFCC